MFVIFGNLLLIESKSSLGYILYIAKLVNIITPDISYNGPFLSIMQSKLVSAIMACGVKSNVSNLSNVNYSLLTL